MSVARPTRRRAIATGLLVVGSFLSGCGLLEDDEYAAFRSMRVGMTEAQVRAVLGEPTHTYTKTNAPPRYYVEGYSFEERAITTKVLIYVGSEPIAYVYVDAKGLVEHVFVGGS